ncbi:MAG: PRD domain-containing protein [Sporolactobacillus sp.]
MDFIKSLNNNAALAKDEYQHEYVVIGTGISFGCHAGDEIAAEKVQRRFVADDEEIGELESLSYIRPDALGVTEQIVRNVEAQLAVKFTQYQYLALADHLDLTLKRLEQGIYLPDSTMGWAVKKLYCPEYQFALKMLHHINESQALSATLSDSEATSLVLHIVSAENKYDQVQDTLIITKLISGIIQIVQLEGQLPLDSESFNYNRFITHLRAFMVNRISDKDGSDSEQALDPSILRLIQLKYPAAYQTVQRIGQYLQFQQNWQLSNNEQVYLAIHVWRVTHRQTTEN